MSADGLLTPRQSDDLRAIARVIIPANLEFDVPGADDPAIQADIVGTLGRDAGLVREALDELARLAGVPLAGLDPTRRESVGMNCARRAGRQLRRSPASGAVRSLRDSGGTPSLRLWRRMGRVRMIGE
jgi:hypothetical protein